jgi:hypothetical protein
MEAPERLPILLFGLINLIPIAGQIAALGWMLETRDNLRAGRTIVPPAGLGHLRRGLRPWFALALVSCVWLAGVVVAGAMAAVVVGAASAWSSRLLLVVVPLGFVVAMLLFGGLLLLGYTWAAVVTVADADGVAAALDPVTLLEVAGANRSASWKTLRVYLVSLLIVLGCVIVPPAALLISAVPYLTVAPWLAEVHLAAPGRP